MNDRKAWCPLQDRKIFLLLPLFVWFVLLTTFVSPAISTVDHPSRISRWTSDIVDAGRENTCRLNSHVNGSWEPQISNMKHFVCCSIEDRSVVPQYCLTSSNGEISNVNSASEAKRSSPRLSVAHSCSCQLKANNFETYAENFVDPVDNYIWRPASCSLPTWDADLFCTLLGNRTVMLLGDSTMQQTTYTLRTMLIQDRLANSSSLRCDHLISYGRTDRLYPPDHHHGFLSVLEYYQYAKPDILIMSAGAHMTDLFHMETVFSQLEEQIEKIKVISASASSTSTSSISGSDNKITNATIIWKTLSPGHYHCMNQSAPVDNFDEYHNGLNLVTHDRYRYRIFPLFDNMARNFSHSLGLKLIDMSPLYLRPDAHPTSNSSEFSVDHPGADCLHFCTPGPVNLFSILFLNMLRNKEI